MLVVLLVTALLSQPSTLPGQRYLPTIQVDQYRWPRAGFSVMGSFRDKMPLFYAENDDGPPMWFQDWWLGCEMYSENGTNYGRGLYHASYIPTLWNTWNPFVLRCRDERPLLVGNEPELESQANLTPVEMATLLHVAVDNWNGPIYCCGTMMQHLPYLQQVIDSYRQMYGQWPVSVGIHAHAYIVGQDGSPIINTIDYADVNRATLAFDEFMSLLSANNLLQKKVVVSECCLLSNTINHEDVLTYTYPLINHIAANNNIATIAWFSVYSQGAPPGSQFVSSDLVTGNEVNSLGQAWLNYALRWRLP